MARHLLALGCVSDKVPLGLLSECCAARSPVGRLVLATDTNADVDELAGLVLLGLNGHGDAPELQGARDITRSCVEAGVPVLGLGLGAQVLAVALGGGISRGAAPQFGMIDVEALPAAQADPVTRLAGGGLPLLHWHEDLIELPPGAELLLRCERLRPQAFRQGVAAYGFQAHLEATVETVRHWANERARAKNNPAFAIRLTGDLGRHHARQAVFARSVIDAWLDVVEHVAR